MPPRRKRRSPKPKRKASVRRKPSVKHPLSGLKRTRIHRQPLWTLDQGVTFSSLHTWEECQEQFGLKYIDGLSTKAISIPLEFGNIIHFGLQYQWKFSSPQETIYHVTNQYRVWRAKTLLNPSEGDTLDFLCGLADATFPAYCEYWHGDDQQIDWVGREEKFDVPYEVVTPEGPRSIRLRGMRDGLFRPVPKILGLFETKTKSRISEQEIRDGLKADMQTLFYCFATWLATGEYPKVIKYNIIRRGDKKYQRKGESVPQYLKRIKEDIASRPDFYFMRFRADLTQRNLEDFRRRTLDPLLVRFIHWWDHVKKNPCGGERFKSPYHSLNLNALHGKYGKADMYAAIVDRNQRPYRIRTAVFPELEDSFLVTH